MIDFTEKSLRYQFGDVHGYGRRAVVEVSPHTLRHSFAKNLVDAGISLDRVAALMGHARLETTRLYTMPGKRDLELAVEAVEAS